MNGTKQLQIELDQWIVEHRDNLERFIKSRGIGDAQADDVFQETWIKAWEKIETHFENGTDLSAWMYEIARNNINDFFRTKSRKPANPMTDAIENEATWRDVSQHKLVVDEEAQEAFEDCLTRLTSSEKAVIVSILDGKNHNTIVEEYGLKSIDQSYQLLSRGKTKMRKCMEAKER